MKLQDIVKIGEIFEVKLGEITVRTKLQEIQESDEFVVFQPTVKGIPIWTNEDEIFRFAFYRANGVYLFEAELIEAFTKDGLNLCLFHVVSEVEKNQRRECYRLPIVLDVTVSEERNDEDEDEPEKHKGKTSELSEKSLKFSCFTPFEPETMLTVSIKLTEKKTITLKARVYRYSEPEKKKDPHVMVLLFVDCSDYHKSYISRYIMRQQILARRMKKSEEI